MSEKKINKDVFLEYLDNTRPLKKSNKFYKENKTLESKPIKKEGNKIEFKKNEKPPTQKRNLKMEHSSLERKLKKGKIPINLKIDFHGLSLDQARQQFFQTINNCYSSQKRCILFITGKGAAQRNQDEKNKKLFYGKIRENFQKWIYEEGVASKILNVSRAGFAHGGDGAFFVYLRKKTKS